MPINNWIKIEKSPTHDNDIWVKIIAHIRNNETGEIRKYETECIFDEDLDSPSTFIWSDGNYSCDCNRYLFFQRAKGEDEDYPKCGDGKYSVNLQNPKTGEYYYKEF